MFVKDLSQTKYGLAMSSFSKEQAWITPDKTEQFYRGGTRSVEIFKHLQKERGALYPNWREKITEEATKIVAKIEDQGYYKIENFWDTEFLDKVRDVTYEMMQEADPEKVKYPQGGRHTQIVHPLENIELANEMASNAAIQSIATAFLGAPPALGTTNLRLSRAENSENLGTNMFHKDFNSPVRFIKFFTYFNDVTAQTGPFTYVHGSNRQLPSNPRWSVQHRWPDEVIESIYGNSRIVNLTASYGDLLIATTNGFHKGLRLESGERLMLTLNYVIHPEVGGQGFAGPTENLHTVKNSTYEKIAEPNKYLYDFMEKV